jgi:hypothetical protein
MRVLLLLLLWAALVKSRSGKDGVGGWTDLDGHGDSDALDAFSSMKAGVSVSAEGGAPSESNGNGRRRVTTKNDAVGNGDATALDPLTNPPVAVPPVADPQQNGNSGNKEETEGPQKLQDDDTRDGDNEGGDQTHVDPLARGPMTTQGHISPCGPTGCANDEGPGDQKIDPQINNGFTTRSQSLTMPPKHTGINANPGNGDATRLPNRAPSFTTDVYANPGEGDATYLPNQNLITTEKPRKTPKPRPVRKTRTKTKKTRTKKTLLTKSEKKSGPTKQSVTKKARTTKPKRTRPPVSEKSLFGTCEHASQA